MSSRSTPGSPSFTYVRAIPASAAPPKPWKNGGGLTREIDIQPAGASSDSFAWRLSAAEVDRAGPFSSYQDIDRTIVLTHGKSMVLRDANGGKRHCLSRGKPYQFAGETAIDAELPDGPTRDFNLMVRRGTASGHLLVSSTAQTLTLAPGHRYLHCAAGAFGIAPAHGQWPQMYDQHTPFVPYLPAKHASAHPLLVPHLQSAHALTMGDTLHLFVAQHASLQLKVAPLSVDACLIDIHVITLADTHR